MTQNEVERTLQCDTAVSMFRKAYKDLGIALLLTQCGIVKGCGFSVPTIFMELLLLVFTGKNLYIAMNCRYSFDFKGKKDVYYRFINNEYFNWGRFLLRLSVRVATLCCNTFTGTSRPCFLVMDDSIIAKESSKHVQNLSRMFDHVNNRSRKCFNLLMLGWTDGYTFLPVQYLMMSSAKHLVKEALDKDWGNDKRSYAERLAKSALGTKLDAAVKMVANALESGLQVTALLVDSWFTNEKFIHEMIKNGMDTIGMLKDYNQRYWYRGQIYDLKAIFNKAYFKQKGDLLGSIVVHTRYLRIPLKIVFVVNRNNRRKWIAIVSTNVDLSDEKIIEYYGNRWSIECCFKVMKGMLGLGKEFQTQTYAATNSTTALVMTRYIILAYLHRINSDPRTINEYCRDLYDEVPRMDFDEALQSLLELVISSISRHPNCPLAVELRSAVVTWYIHLPLSVKSILPELPFDADPGKADIPLPDDPVEEAVVA